jgi:hypothetical protein
MRLRSAAPLSFRPGAIDSEKDRVMFVGPTSSYFEFTEPAGERMTDEQ